MADRRSDAELVKAALEGSGEAFGTLVARYKDAVFGVAYHRLGDFEEARDAAQEALVKVFTNLSKLREPAAFPHWLYRIADGTALDQARQRKPEVSLDEAARPAPDAAPQHTEEPGAEEGRPVERLARVIVELGCEAPAQH